MNDLIKSFGYFDRAISKTLPRKIKVTYIEQVDIFVPSPLDKKKLVYKPF